MRMTSYGLKILSRLKLYIVKRKLIFCHEYAIYFISLNDENYISFVVLPTMKYAFSASLYEINSILIPKCEYPLFNNIKPCIYNLVESITLRNKSLL